MKWERKKLNYPYLQMIWSYTKKTPKSPQENFRPDKHFHQSGMIKNQQLWTDWEGNQKNNPIHNSHRRKEREGKEKEGKRPLPM
jgi:hypothetical protein